MEYIYKNDLGEIVGRSNVHMIIEGATEEEATEEDIALFEDNQLISRLRMQRDEECFSVINQNYIVDGKSATWFDILTEEQKIEANEWVQAWRDVTKTKQVPEKPSWLR